MTVKIQRWTKEKAETEIAKRFQIAMAKRNKVSENWDRIDAALWPNRMRLLMDHELPYAGLAGDTLSISREDSSGFNVSMNYLWKNYKFIHSQVAANPPAVSVKPNSNEWFDRRAAKAGASAVDWFRVQYNVQDIWDRAGLCVVAYGNALIKIFHDPLAGDVRDFDEATGEVILDGDIVSYAIHPRNFLLDPVAKNEEEIRFIFEKHTYSIEEATFRFPHCADKFKEWSDKQFPEIIEGSPDREREMMSVTIWEYTEKGMPWNGGIGYNLFTFEGKLISPEITENPYTNHSLPYILWTDLDVPDEAWGESVIEKVLPLQDLINRIDATLIDNVAVAGRAKLIVFQDADGAGSEDDDDDDSAFTIRRVGADSTTAPIWQQPPQTMPALIQLRQAVQLALDDLMGVNEFMKGQINRELATSAVQTAIKAGNLVRRRLFNKYEKGVKYYFKTALAIMATTWDEAVLIKVVGKENAFNISYLKGADLRKGFDIETQLGANFSLDPELRREEILQMWDKFKAAGMTDNQLVRMLKYNDTESLYDVIELAENRQIDIIDQMVSSVLEEGEAEIYIAPKENELHAEMLNAAIEFIHSATYATLPQEAKLLVEKHIADRKQMLAAQSAGAAAPAGPAAALPIPGLSQGGSSPI